MEEKKVKPWNDPGFLFVACATLGLAPFAPPHIIGKIQWVAGGAIGMQPLDWFDLFYHGAPWILLIRYLVLKFVVRSL